MQIHIEHATIHLPPSSTDMLTLRVREPSQRDTAPPSAPEPTRSDTDMLRASAFTPPALGELWPGQGGYYVGTWPAMGGLPARHVIAASTDSAEALTWGGYGNDAPSAASRIDGAANTRALGADGTPHPAAAFCKAYTEDGHTDYHLPSQADLFLASLNAQGRFNPDSWYWTSTQDSAGSAFAQDFRGGTSNWLVKAYEFRVRAFRTIHVTP